MKRRKLLSLAPLAGVVAALCYGVGFAAWTFNTTTEATFSESAVITNKIVDEGEITLDNETFYLVIDQNFLGWSTVEYVFDSETNTDNIEAVKAAKITSITPTFTLKDGSASTLDDFTYTCSFDGSAVASYISFTDFADEWTSETAIDLPVASWVEAKNQLLKANMMIWQLQLVQQQYHLLLQLL